MKQSATKHYKGGGASGTVAEWFPGIGTCGEKALSDFGRAKT